MRSGYTALHVLNVLKVCVFHSGTILVCGANDKTKTSKITNMAVSIAELKAGAARASKESGVGVH